MRKPWCYLSVLLACTGARAESGAGPAADEALARLIPQLRPNQSVARRKELGNGQHPFAVILGCADSRVSPELLFDQ